MCGSHSSPAERARPCPRHAPRAWSRRRNSPTARAPQTEWTSTPAIARASAASSRPALPRHRHSAEEYPHRPPASRIRHATSAAPVSVSFRPVNTTVTEKIYSLRSHLHRDLAPLNLPAALFVAGAVLTALSRESWLLAGHATIPCRPTPPWNRPSAFRDSSW